MITHKTNLNSSFLGYLSFVLAIGGLFYYLDEGRNILEAYKFFRQAKPLNAIIYSGWFVVSSLVFIAWLFAKPQWWRSFALLVLGVTFFFEFAGHWIAGEGVSYHGILQIEQNSGFSLDDEVWDSFGWQLVISVLLSLGLLGLIYWLQQKVLVKRVHHWFIYILPVITFVAGYFLIKKTEANRTDFPFPYKVIDVYAYAKLNGMYLGARKKVPVAPVREPVVDHIVLIVDESIRGDYLSINGFQDSLTPFLVAQDSLILNYGIASSGGVCSNYSNAILLSGANREELPDISQNIMEKPNIFQYAKQANLTPNILYSIGFKDHPSGFWSQNDMQTTENKWFVGDSYPNIPAYQKDQKALDLLEKIIQEGKSFTYFLKFGAHFHFENSYPPTGKIYSPTQAIGDWEKSNRIELINSYKNAVHWNVNEFFKLINEKFKNEKILFIYTSDHGQNLMDVEGVKLTHCAKGPAPVEMATVPLFLYSPNPVVVEKIKEKYISANLDQASHFNIFPSLLELFGYDKQWISDHYDASLFEAFLAEKRNYTSGDIFGRSEMYWNDFD